MCFVLVVQSRTAPFHFIREGKRGGQKLFRKRREIEMADVQVIDDNSESTDVFVYYSDENVSSKDSRSVAAS